MHYSIERGHRVTPITWHDGKPWVAVAAVYRFRLQFAGPRAPEIVLALPDLAALRAAVRGARRRGMARA